MHGGDFPQSQRTAIEAFGLRRLPRAAGRGARSRAAIIGIGIGNYVEGTGLGPFEGVTIRVMPNGKVAVATGATNAGPGHAHDAVADRRRSARLPDRGHRHDASATPARSRRASAPSPAARRSTPARRRMIAGEAVRKQVVALARRARSACRRATSTSRTASAIARTGNKPIADVRRAGAAWRRACRASRSRRARRRGSSTPPISRRRRRRIATARTSSRSRSIR